MSKADEYLGYARQCQQLADETQSPEDKRRWRKIAESWFQQAAKPDNKDEGSDPANGSPDRHQAG